MTGQDGDIQLVPSDWKLPVTLALIGERLASLEARLTAETSLRAGLEARLENDMSSIRNSMHEIRQNQQASVAAEHQCSLGLATLGDKYETISRLIETMSRDIRDISEARYKMLGGWAAIIRTFAAIGVISSLAAAIVAVLTYAAKRL